MTLTVTVVILVRGAETRCMVVEREGDRYMIVCEYFQNGKSTNKATLFETTDQKEVWAKLYRRVRNSQNQGFNFLGM